MNRYNLVTILMVAAFFGCNRSNDQNAEKYSLIVSKFNDSKQEKSTFLTPIILAKANRNDEILIPFALSNPTELDIFYAANQNEATLFYLTCRLFRNGIEINANSSDKVQPATKNDIRKIQPGRVVAFQYQLPFKNLPPGSYQLFLQYNIRENTVNASEIGITVMNVSQSLFLELY